MAKIVRRKRRRLSLNGIALIVFTFSLIAWLITTLLVNTINTSLTMKIQTMSEELAMLKTENQSLNYEIQTLENKDRVYEVAQAANMDQILENIISVTGN
ncbi:MAG: hypothetical protein IJI44_02985 [Erysipelotrichaceae bacterium]|nr:hypothetical protein [Erysipelotrichaceae bacterium]